jgi:hypothetical protein
MKPKYVLIVYDEQIENEKDAKELRDALISELLEESDGYTCEVGEIQEDGTIKTV